MARDIAICIQSGDDLSAPFESRFGRAPAFLVTNSEGTDFRVVANQGASAGHGAGTGAAALMGSLGVKRVVAGRFGPKAHRALAALGVGMWLAPEGGTAASVLAALEQGDLEMQL